MSGYSGKFFFYIFYITNDLSLIVHISTMIIGDLGNMEDLRIGDTQAGLVCNYYYYINI